MGLSTAEMKEVEEVLNEAYLKAFSRSPIGLHQKLLAMSFDLLRLETPTMLFNGYKPSIDRLLAIGMDDADHRRFVLEIQFHFFARFGFASERYDALCDSLAQGLGGLQRDDKHVLVAAPQSVWEQFGTYEDIKNLLLQNRWMVILALMVLFLVTPNDMAVIYGEWRQREALRLHEEQKAAQQEAARKTAAAAAQAKA